MLAGITGWHLLIIVAVLLLIFGATRLPALSRGIGQSIRILRHETKDPDRESVRSTIADDIDHR
ncbi:twin-arginine translocase TatA/TatE family subunit [Humibacter sp.]|jgi:sec-independent protein translocase protein TatA|uniref:twin-arginine translocase TatA/TatE family subunit n=1 Tax=Humibacter sp. TaxID=1940291 RepID=UPI002C289762|nr:twin-arginine translocase TatA/TatE family subunit [Humibacter sp.]HVX09130.1 twin-arginine translocase TatA/TatE family subunit [Humibacter sp.]